METLDTSTCKVKDNVCKNVLSLFALLGMTPAAINNDCVDHLPCDKSHITIH